MTTLLPPPASLPALPPVEVGSSEVPKPHLRGWLHVTAVPLALLLGGVLVSIAPTEAARAATGVFTLMLVILFATSALYHRGSWSPRTLRLLKRIDHSNIFLVIAGTHTPFLVLMLPLEEALPFLWVVWVAAALGVLFKVAWVDAPRWVGTPLYMALGWIVVAYMGDILSTGGWWAVLLIVLGGLVYSLGALAYTLRWPDPNPAWFGHHEIFHSCTLGGFLLHWAAVLVMVLTLA